MKNLILIRHGKLKIFEQYSVHSLMRGTDVYDMLRLYDSCELSDRSFPKQKVVEICKNADCYICSELKRTSDSFTRMGISSFERTDLLNEAMLPSNILRWALLPMGLWAFVLRLFWFAGYRGNCESYSDFIVRMKQAFQCIDSQFDNSDTIVVMAHGFVNIILKRIFKKHGWLCVESSGKNGYWSYTKMTYT